MGYYHVTAKCGHVGKGYYIPITFAVKAGSATEAASYTRLIPRVKHDHKDAILQVEEVDIIDYLDLYYYNSFDPYLQCRNKREQMQEYDTIIFRIKEEDKRDYNTGKEMPDKPIYAGKKRIRNVRRYAKEQASMYAMLEAM